jgi:hypothetical protein
MRSTDMEERGSRQIVRIRALKVKRKGNHEPMTGPRTDPIAHIIEMIDIHFPLSRRVTMSVRTTYVKDTKPPPPTPWIHLPTSRSSTLWAIEQTIVPIVNSSNAAKITDLRPMTCEKEAHEG